MTDLAYSSIPSIGVDSAKIAILAASLVAGLLGAAVLFGRGPPRRASPAHQARRMGTGQPCGLPALG